MARTPVFLFTLAVLVVAGAALAPATVAAQDGADTDTESGIGDIARWLPAADGEATAWREEPQPWGPARVALLIGFNRFSDDRWALPGTDPTLRLLGRTFANRLHFRPVITQSGPEAATWRLRETLRGMRARFTRPGGSLLVYLRARAFRDGDGHLHLLTDVTTAAEGDDGDADTRYADPLAITDLADWLREFGDKLGDHAPRIALVLELHADPLGVGMGDRDGDADHESLTGLHRLWLAGPTGTCADNLRADASDPARALATSINTAPTHRELTLADLMASLTRALPPASAPTLAAPDDQRFTLQPETVSLTVDVVDARTGEAVAGAVVTCDGRLGVAPYRATTLREGAVPIHVEAPGYLPVEQSVAVTRAQDGERLEVALLPSFGLVRVVVQTADGDPVSAQLVTAGAGDDGLGDLVRTPGIHRRAATTNERGVAWLPVPLPALAGPLRVSVGAASAGDETTVVVPAADRVAGTVTLRGATVTTHRLAPLAVDAAASRAGLAFRGVGGFAWEQARDALASLPMHDLPIAVAGFRSALDDAADDATRTACRATLRRTGLWFLRYCRSHSDDEPGLLEAGATVAEQLIEVFPDDTDVLQEKEHFEFTALPADLRRAVTDAVTLATSGDHARAAPLLRAVLADPRLPVAFRARCERLLADCTRAVVRRAVGEARELYTRGRFLDALQAIERAEPLQDELALVGALRARILDALARHNMTRDRAMPLRSNQAHGDANSLDVRVRSRLDANAAERWYRLDLARPAAVQLRLFAHTVADPADDAGDGPDDDAADALRVTLVRDGVPLAEDDTAGVPAVIRGAGSRPVSLSLSAGRYLLCVTRRDDTGDDPSPFALHVRATLHDMAASGAEAPDSWVRATEPLAGHTTRDRAVPLLPGEYRNQRIETSHWFRVTIPRPLHLRVKLDVTSAATDSTAPPVPRGADDILALSFERADGTVIPDDGDARDDPAALWSGEPEPGDYFIHLQTRTGNPVRYTLTIEVSTHSSEATRGFTPDTALPLLTGEPLVAEVRAFQPRWYSFRLAQPAMAWLRCQFRHAHGDIDMAIYDRRTMRELLVSGGTDDGEQLRLPLAAGEYYVKVWNGTPDSTARFVLVLTHVPAGPRSGVSAEAARPLPTDEPIELTVEPDAPRWFRVELDELARVSITADFDVADGDIGLAVFDHHADAPVAETDSRQAPERLDRTLPRGIYLLKVFNTRPDAVTRVTLSARVQPLTGNHTRADAIPIRPGLIEGLPLEQKDLWFAVDLPDAASDGTAGRMVVVLNWPGTGHAELAAFTPDDTDEPSATSALPSNGACVMVPTDRPGRYLLRIHNATPETRLRLTLDITRAPAGSGLRALAAPLAVPDVCERFAPLGDDGAQIEPGGSRWYIVHLAQRRHLTIDAEFRHANGDIDLRLWRDREQIAWSESVADNESLGLDLDAGFYFLQVTNASRGDTPQTCRLFVTATPPRTEGGGSNVSPETARPLTPYEMVTGRVAGATSRWYSFRIDADQLVRVDAAFRAGDEITLTLRRGSEVLAVGQTLEDSAVIQRSLPAGEYRVAVSAASNDPADFALMLTAGPAAPGRTVADARPLGPGRLDAVDLPGADSHVYVLPVLRSSTVTITCRFPHDDGDIDIRLTRLDDRELFSSADTQDVETLTGNLPAGLFLLHVRNTTNGGRNRYSLEVELEARAEAEDLPRAEWTNVSRETARLLRPGEVLEGRAGDGVDAWYRVSCTAEVLVTITLDFRHANGDLDMDLRGPGNDTPVAESSGESDREVIRRLCSPGDWDLRVFNYSGGQPNSFRVRVELTELGPGASPDRAIVITPDDDGRFVVDGKLTAGGLPSWLRITPTSDARLEVELRTNPALGDLDMSVFVPESNLPPSMTSGIGPRERIERSVPGGQVLIRIHNPSGGNDSTPFRLTGRMQLYGDAVDREHAVPIGAGAMREQTAEPGRERWMILDLASPTRLLLIVTFSEAPGAGVRVESGSGPVARTDGIAGMCSIRETLPAGRYFIVVEGAPGEEALQYDLHLELTDPSVTTGRAAARLIKPGVRLSGSCSSERSVWLLLVLPKTTRVDLRVEFVHARGDIDLRLFRGSDLVDEANGTEDGERISRLLPPGIYFLEIHNVDSGSTNPWRLALDVDGSADKEFR